MYFLVSQAQITICIARDVIKTFSPKTSCHDSRYKDLTSCWFMQKTTKLSDHKLGKICCQENFWWRLLLIKWSMTLWSLKGYSWLQGCGSFLWGLISVHGLLKSFAGNWSFFLFTPVMSIKQFLLMNHDRSLSDTLFKIKNRAKKIAQDTAFECNRWPQRGRSGESKLNKNKT